MDAVSNNSAIIPACIALAAVGGTALLAWYQTTQKRSANSSDPFKWAMDTSESSSSDSNVKLKNVWESGKKSSKSDALKKGHDGKPFGSSYYYAHNNPNTTGGYKDGLRMEDFTMNGPRLLSKDGQKLDEDVVIQHSIHDEGDEQGGGDNSTAENPSSANDDTNNVAPGVGQGSTRSTAPIQKKISKYLWDDPGDWNGIATIRIDTLPGRLSTEVLEFSKVSVKQVSAELISNGSDESRKGLMVQLETEEHGSFQLSMKELYGQVDTVKTIVKAKRLMVKLYKTKKSILALQSKSNLEAWPQPHKKI